MYQKKYPEGPIKSEVKDDNAGQKMPIICLHENEVKIYLTLFSLLMKVE